MISVIGEGGYGCVYSARDLANADNQSAIAVKIEKTRAKKPLLRMETMLLKLLRSCHSQHAVEYMSCGNDGLYSYMAMELVGENLNQLRRSRLYGRFSLPTAVQLGKKMISAIRDVHNVGFVHRDIKPGNFAVGRGTKSRELYILDFGLARQFCDADGIVRPPRANAGFRGTMRYSSINSMQRHEQDRADDLMSFLYVLCEFFRGPLPWRRAPTKELVLQMKQHYNRERLLDGLPMQLYAIYDHITGLMYGDIPNYDQILRWLQEILEQYGFHENFPFDWEQNPENAAQKSLSPNSLLNSWLGAAVVQQPSKVPCRTNIVTVRRSRRHKPISATQVRRGPTIDVKQCQHTHTAMPNNDGHL